MNRKQSLFMPIAPQAKKNIFRRFGRKFVNVVMGMTPEAEDVPQICVRTNTSATKMSILIEFRNIEPNQKRQESRTLVQKKSSEPT